MMFDAAAQFMGDLLGFGAGPGSMPGPGASDLAPALVGPGGLAPDSAAQSFSISGFLDELMMSKEEKALRDKQKEAAALLQGKFEIGDPEAAARDPLRTLGVADNMVSQEDFDAISKTFAQVMLGQGHLKLDTAGLDEKGAAEYQAKMLEDIGSIMQTKSGRAMVSQLVAGPNEHDTVLKPRFKNGDPSQGLDTENGEAEEKDTANAVLKGRGSDTDITVNPGAFVTNPNAADKWLPMRSDVLLYHEMVHALDQTRGTLRLDDIIGGQDMGHHECEHAAVGLGDFEKSWISENNYRASRAEIAADSFTGVREGDDNMVQRDSYAYHRK